MTSLEVGVGLVLLYAIARPLLPGRTSVGHGMILAVLLLAVTGRLFRQGVMDTAIGNPASVVLVQNGSTWAVWVLMCVAAASVFDLAIPRDAGGPASPPAR
jgi:hypothetical protein